LAKAKAVRPFAEKMITLGKRDDLHSRRVAFASLRQKEAVRKLFAELGPRTSAPERYWLSSSGPVWCGRVGSWLDQNTSSSASN